MASLAFAFCLLLGAVAHAEEPRNINECEKIQAADAYNQCLAKFGPTSKLRNLEPERPGDVKSSSEEAAKTAKPLATKGRVSRRHAGGRRRMHFTITHRRHR
jgi:hypothetical protein